MDVSLMARMKELKWLSSYQWNRLSEAQDFTINRMWSYNNFRPHTALFGFTPK